MNRTMLKPRSCQIPITASGGQHERRLAQEGDLAEPEEPQRRVDRAEPRMKQRLPHRRHRDQGRGDRQEVDDLVEPARPGPAVHEHRDEETEQHRSGEDERDIKKVFRSARRKTGSASAFA